MPHSNLKELTFRGMILGALITVIFTASNVYLGLKVGMTFASSIPAAVISMAVLKFFKDSSILENNMVQTQASAAGTLSSVIFVLPGLLMMGYWNDFPFWQTMLICAAGGTLGVLFTIPLRRAMVVNSDLPYPEGVAAAEILKAGNHDKGDTGVKDIAYGGVFAGVVAFLTNGLRVIAPVLEILYHAYGFSGALPRADMDPTQALSAPQATIMTTISQGIFTNQLEWTYILTGVGLGAVLIVIDAFLKKVSNKAFALPVLAVGIGIYLPPSINTPVVIGAFLAWFINRHIASYAARTGNQQISAKAERFGTLFSAGLIVGESLMGVILAFVIAASVTSGGSEAPLALNLKNWDRIGEILGLTVFIAGIIIFASRVLRAKKSD
ncbi:OPT family oligopeptide transporter [Rodentibacter trehalosifermentans]|nr:oligopeptide transporter, OPT family [Rodentibacter trehalosifermentans]